MGVLRTYVYSDVSGNLLALWVGYYLGAAYQRGMFFLSSLVYYAATLWILFPFG